MEQEGKEIGVQLTLSKPLVTEMLWFLNQKSEAEEFTLEMTNLIEEISDSLIQMKMQAQKFHRAAYYDSATAQKPFQAIKEGGQRLQAGANKQEFEKMIQGDIQE